MFRLPLIANSLPEDFIEKSYEDKLTGNISKEIWLKNNRKWSEEKDRIIAEIVSLDDSKDEYMNRGVALIELIQHADIIYKSATPERKRQFIELVSSNLRLADGNIGYYWKKPFEMLAVNGDLEKWRRT